MIPISLFSFDTSQDELTSQGIRECKIITKLYQPVCHLPPWCQDLPLYLLKPSCFTTNCSQLTYCCSSLLPARL